MQARYARERHQLYRAKSFGARLTSPVRLRELERISDQAQARLRAAEAERAASHDAPSGAT